MYEQDKSEEEHKPKIMFDVENDEEDEEEYSMPEPELSKEL